MMRMKRIGSFFVAIIVLSLFEFSYAVIDETDRELVAANFPYGRGVDSDQLQLARLLLFPQRNCHTKRNSELINSLLGLPKNMNNAGK
ncbi:hypothetical protein PV325_000652 [Microctonus aethiopoides]|uniref:Pigment-dispersing factor n=1 Tax=Microctonus aethiopoides TaxID=144406 RepID=A0AA39KRF8_9HYME|nr:hypothetical protein PV326_009720 [Microctonus aethiopoides]KAK0079905.1 hypothetical protein PV325_000652 [Microctonus aethiopoides]KAK0170846.1 hypothetical protein PV328_008643 [Microctonus aethiopoides]